MITETPEVAEAIEQALKTWPELEGSRAAALRMLLKEGAASIDAAIAQKRDSRLVAIEQFAGKYSNVWPASWREEELSQWPE